MHVSKFVPLSNISSHSFQNQCQNLKDGGDLLGGDGNIVIGEDEGGVNAGELRVGHF